ncbi:hypothetical protein [Microbacterium sp.]|uniref:hypothetical protein n=1 Tax=Microbacterium sp. TaxID=51671 RepID=UPI0032423365
MNDYADLIAKLREDVAGGEYSGGGYRYVEVLPDTAVSAIAAIEALVKERDELAAVIDELRQWAAATRYKVSGNHDTFDTYHEGIDRAQGEVEGLISEVPFDALREHDAALIEHLLDDAILMMGGDGVRVYDNREAYDKGSPRPPRIKDWLRERARQVREGNR